MSNELSTVISDIRQYSDPKHPESSTYNTIRPKTVTEAVFDSKTREPMSATLSSMKTSIEELKKSVSEGKSVIASTLTENGVSTAQDAPFDTINTNVGLLAQQKYNEGKADGSKNGGIADLPTHPASISVAVDDGEATLSLTYSNTEFLKGVLIAYKTGGYPTSPTDGNSVDTIGQPTSVTITNLANNLEYYFRVFLYNMVGDKKYYQTDVINARIIGIPFPSLENASWDLISSTAEQGLASEYWNMGDTKNITLSTGEKITVRIEDFDHDDLTTGGKAPVTFGMVDCLKDMQQMNSEATNDGGWGSSEMRTSRMATLFSQFPSDLQKVIKSVTKTTSAGNRSSSLTTTDDKLWLFSYTELNFGRDTGYSPGGEGTAYPLFISSDSRLKNVDGIVGVWWLRSPRTIDTKSFSWVRTGGTASYSDANLSRGVAVGFCI